MNTENSSILHMNDVTKSFGSKEVRINAVDNINLQIAAGELCVLAGRSGSGKTTLLNLAGLIDQPSSGEIYFNGVATSDMSDVERAQIRLQDISFIFQDFGLLPFLQVRENIAYKLMLQGYDRKFIQDSVEKVAARFGIESKLTSYPSQLSGGQQQRASIARAIASKTQLLIADELTANLDEENSVKVMTLLKEAQLSSKMAIIIATHDPLVKSYASKLYEIRDGRITESVGD
jgi:putative ABC transport system ATP-binding protein